MALLKERTAFCMFLQPPTEKLHQIIARTAMFVSRHGGQSEIVLRVKQGDNPTFGFLMPDHHLHAYFRFLVDHRELLESDVDGKTEEEKKADNEENQTGGVGGGGALSLLGSVYGSGEDEEGTNMDSSESQENDRKETSTAANTAVSHGSEGMVSSMNIDGNNEAIPKHLPPKEKAPLSKRNRVASTVKGGAASSLKKKSEDLGSLGAAMDKSQTSALPSTSKVKTLVLEPPSDLKRLVDKIVEFILKNGKEFEAVLVEQDNKHGRFPFLLPSNQYYPYYLQVLQKAQESKLTGKNLNSEKDGLDKRTASSNDATSLGSSYHDMPYDSDRKEKFKMVLGKSRKDGQDHPSKPTQQQIGVSLDTAAAILQAATRGIKNPSFDILPRTSSNGISHGLSSEGGQASSFQSRFSSQPHSSSQKSDPNEGPSVSVPVAKAIANTAALAAASEADSSEAHLTKEQKLKAERLKRAKMFAAIIKGGAGPLKTETVRSLSVEPPESGVSGLGGLGGEALNLASKEREGSSVPVDVDTSGKTEKPEREHSDTEHNERRSRRKYRSRSKKHEEEEDDDDDNYGDDGKEDEKEDKRDHKHSRKKHRSHRSSHRSGDRHKHRKRHSSSKDRESRHRHKHEYSDDEYRDRRKRSKKSHSEREADLEEGEISTKSSDQSKVSVGEGASREASVDLSNSHQDPRPPSQPSDTTQVSDDLRAKIRAMLLATL